jgi:hypothetical protein
MQGRKWLGEPLLGEEFNMLPCIKFPQPITGNQGHSVSIETRLGAGRPGFESRQG